MLVHIRELLNLPPYRENGGTDVCEVLSELVRLGLIHADSLIEIKQGAHGSSREVVQVLPIRAGYHRSHELILWLEGLERAKLGFPKPESNTGAATSRTSGIRSASEDPELLGTGPKGYGDDGLGAQGDRLDISLHK